jgi:DNA-binding transcriptional LysR family regulator
MDLQQLRYFVAVAEEEHFGRAAVRLRIAQPALSRRMHQLEDEMRVQLFDRLPRGIRLTESGRTFLTDARGLLSDLARALARARRVEAGEVGQLRVGYVDTTMGGSVLAPVLHGFRARNPEVGLELIRLVSMAQWEALRDGRIDIGVAFFRAPEPEEESLSVETQRAMLALPDVHPLARAPKLMLRDLADEPFVAVERTVSPMLDDLLTQQCARGGLTMHVRHEVKDFTGQIGLVAAGLGIAWVVASASRQLPRNVVLRPVDDLDLTLETCVMWRRDRLGATGRAFVGAVRDYLGSR